MSTRVQSRTDLGSGDRWTEVRVACGVVRADGHCAVTFATVQRAGETDGATKRRALANALAGRWIKIGRVLYCPRCARESGRAAP